MAVPAEVESQGHREQCESQDSGEVQGAEGGAAEAQGHLGLKSKPPTSPPGAICCNCLRVPPVAGYNHHVFAASRLSFENGTRNMSCQWFYIENGKETGPLSSADMRRLADAKLIRESTLVRAGVDGKWRPANAVVGLLRNAPSAQQLDPMPPTPPPLPSVASPPAPPVVSVPAAEWIVEKHSDARRVHPIAWIAIGCGVMAVLVLIAAINGFFATPKSDSGGVAKVAPKADSVKHEASPVEPQLERVPTPVDPHVFSSTSLANKSAQNKARHQSPRASPRLMRRRLLRRLSHFRPMHFSQVRRLRLYGSKRKMTSCCRSVGDRGSSSQQMA